MYLTQVESNDVHVDTLRNLKEKYDINEIACAYDGTCELKFTIWTGNEKCHLTYPVRKGDAFFKIDILNMMGKAREIKILIDSKNSKISFSGQKINKIEETVFIHPVYKKGKHFTYQTSIDTNKKDKIIGTIETKIEYEGCILFNNPLFVDVKMVE